MFSISKANVTYIDIIQHKFVIINNKYDNNKNQKGILYLYYLMHFKYDGIKWLLTLHIQHCKMN